MTLGEAIYIVNSMERTLAPTMAASGTDALKLLIEAGKREQKHREDYPMRDPELLPGETEE